LNTQRHNSWLICDDCREKEGGGKQNSREKVKVKNYPTQMYQKKYKLMKNLNIPTKTK
jgi:hypothetical protein